MAFEIEKKKIKTAILQNWKFNLLEKWGANLKFK